MNQFSFKSSAEKRIISINGFLGADFTSSPENSDMRRSPDCPNMIRDTPGKNRKRNGYFLTHTFPGEVNGIHIFNKEGEESFLVHAGTSLYLKGEDGYTEIYASMNNARSCFAVLAGRLIILDGSTMLSYDGDTVSDINSHAYVPTVVIGRAPSGGGTLYEPINMISDNRIDKFTGDGTSTRYYVSAGEFEAVTYVMKRSASGEWSYLKFDKDYDYREDLGYVIFNTAPAAPDDGEDNILICYKKYNTEYRNIIYSCNICTLYGINGALDRIFITGCSKYPNRDYYCQMEDPTYWGDTWYGNIGKSDTTIVGYSLVENCLATHKANEESSANIILRSGVITDNEPCFPIVGTYSSSGAICKDSFSILDNEPVYLSKDGICAITPSDVLGERFSQVRSHYLNGRLLKEENMQSGSAVTYKGFYMLLLNEKIYILDGLQSIISGGTPFSHRQYEGYLWTGIPGKFLFTDGKFLYFAASAGRLYRFYTEEENGFDDDGEEYEAYWETAFFSGDDFSKYKTINGIDVSLDSDADKTIVEYENSQGEWESVAQGSPGRDNKLLCRRIHIKNCTGVKFRIKNSSGNNLKINKLQISYINGKNIK